MASRRVKPGSGSTRLHQNMSSSSMRHGVFYVASSSSRSLHDHAFADQLSDLTRRTLDDQLDDESHQMGDSLFGGGGGGGGGGGSPYQPDVEAGGERAPSGDAEASTEANVEVSLQASVRPDVIPVAAGPGVVSRPSSMAGLQVLDQQSGGVKLCELYYWMYVAVVVVSIMATICYAAVRQDNGTAVEIGGFTVAAGALLITGLHGRHKSLCRKCCQRV